MVDGVSFDVVRQETVALVGESGSGKSVTALSIVGLNADTARIDAGRIMVDDHDLLAMDEEERRSYRGRRIAMIFQSPRSSLNPLVKAGDQIARVVRLRSGADAKPARRQAVELMGAVGIEDPERRYNAYPHQLSGGMAQRVMIAMALAVRPELLIADEPTTALDVTIQKQIFELLTDLQERYGMSILLITHDLGVVAETSDRVVVLLQGPSGRNRPGARHLPRARASLHSPARRLDPSRRPACAAARPTACRGGRRRSGTARPAAADR